MAVGTIPIPFAIGDEVWWAQHTYTSEWIVCPDCANTRVTTLILGCGEQVTVDCELCQRGFESPSGRVEVVEWKSVVTPFVCREVSVHGDDFYYKDGSKSAEAKHLFANKADAESRCDEMITQFAKDQAERCSRARGARRKSAAGHAAYYRQKIRECEKDLVRYRDYLARVKHEAKETT